MAAAYDPAYGDIIIQMEFPVDFAEGDVVVPVLGILDPETNVVTWIALDAVVNADGFVEITFTEDVFAQIAEDSITMLAMPRLISRSLMALGRAREFTRPAGHPFVELILFEPESIITNPEQIPGRWLGGRLPAGRC